jgi:CubicO group peptidase (beta-lactamase class C family)
LATNPDENTGLIDMTKFIVLLLLLAAGLAGCNPTVENKSVVSQAPAPVETVILPTLSDPEIHRIDSLLNRVLRNYRFNGNALVAYKGYPIFRRSKGFKDLNTKDTLNFNTAFQIASVSKAFTAMSVLILSEQGYFCLDDSIIQFIPEFPFDNVTIKQLLQHTSGMQNYMYYVDHQWEKDKRITNEDVLQLLNDNNPRLNFRPGRKHHYNNTGYTMLALLVERVSGMPFHQFLEENIFTPLQMDHTFAWNIKAIDTTSNIATGFTRRGWRYRKFEHNPLDEVLGDKSVYTTVDDLLKWDQALYTDVLISDSLKAEAFTPGKTSRNRTFKYGYGWRLKEDNGKKVVYHNGLWNGFTSSLTRYVDDSLTIILLNNTNAAVASVVRQMHSVLEKELQKDEIITKKK